MDKTTPLSRAATGIVCLGLAAAVGLSVCGAGVSEAAAAEVGSAMTVMASETPLYDTASFNVKNTSYAAHAKAVLKKAQNKVMRLTASSEKVTVTQNAQAKVVTVNWLPGLSFNAAKYPDQFKDDQNLVAVCNIFAWARATNAATGARLNGDTYAVRSIYGDADSADPRPSFTLNSYHLGNAKKAVKVTVEGSMSAEVAKFTAKDYKAQKYLHNCMGASTGSFSTANRAIKTITIPAGYSLKVVIG